MCIFVNSFKFPLEKLFQFMLLPIAYKQALFSSSLETPDVLPEKGKIVILIFFNLVQGMWI